MHNNSFLFSGLRIEVKPTEEHRTEEQLHFARWTGQAEFSLLVQSGSHLYFTRSIVDRSSSGFQCLTCRLPKGWTYAYPAWIYRSIVPYQSTAKFVSALAEKGVQYSMLPLFDADHEYAERQDLKESLLTHLSVFLCDCLRSKDTARANLYRRLHMEGPA
ncbi:unnamed protein product [Dicrocoelium dendriticum]|nr:unnamed protein product [Dicrocoelium dendriticum]